MLKRITRIILKTILVLLVVANLFIVFTGRFYIYRAVYYTYLHGQSGPGIFDKDYFYSREVSKGTGEPWATSAQYNKRGITAGFKQKLEDLGTTSFVVIKNDSLLFEEYYDGFDAGQASNSFSMAKSVVGLLIGIAVDEKKINSIDDPVSKYLQGYAEGNRKKITLRHLLAMSSDMQWNESAANPLSDNAEAYYGTDLEAIMEDIDYGPLPGKTFDYKSGSTQVLGQVLVKVTGKSVSAYASEKIWQKIGAEQTAYWSLDHENGMEKAYCCLYATTRDFARLGRLMLHHGKWNGTQVVDSAYVAQSVQPGTKTNADGTENNRYGLTWWLTTHKDKKVFYARGIKGQYVICIPADNLIVVRTGHKRGDKRADDQPEEIYAYIDAALAME